MKTTFLTLVLLISLSCVYAQTTGSFQTTISFNSSNHTVAYHVPTSYDSTIKYPAVVALHGCGGNAVSYRNSFKSISDSLNAILICPDFMGSQMSGSNGQLIVRAIDSTIIDLNYNIDTTKVYLTGFSCNGQETMKQGFSNIYPFKGLIPLNAWTPNLTGYNYTTANIPTCICSGTADGSHGRNQTIYNNLISNGKKARWNPMPGITHTSSFSTRDSEMMECFNWIDTLGQGAASSCDSLKASAYPSDTICLGSGIYSASIGGSPSASGGASPYSYSWNHIGSGSSVSNSSGSNPTAIVNAKHTSFILTVTDSLGCVVIDTVVIDTNCISGVACSSFRVSATNRDTICVGNGIYTANIGGAPSAVGGNWPYSYSWSSMGTGSSVSNSSNPNPIATVGSRYSNFILTVTDAMGCIEKDSVVIDTACDNVITSIFENNFYSFSIYPNPAQNIFKISFDDNNLGLVSLKIINLKGAVLLTENRVYNNQLINTSDLSEGVYFVVFYQNDIPINSKKLILLK